ncbi:MAG: decaprenyl-phosphate phosphoribosyltransferase [Planctomycetota bacterium]|nr:decaprenyl-phosphate phosphoribosyltransferase [Planctomycetota bacterium]
MNPVALLRAMRPHQWVKNVFVLAALVFALGEAGPEAPSAADRVVRVLLATAAFCLGASAIYLVNDVVDVESDRQHPKKRKRPIAAGELSIPAALVASVGCVLGSLALADRATPSAETVDAGSVMTVVGVYMASNLLYSLKLKHLAIVDAFLIALGFMLRVVAGAYAAAAPISHWLLLSTLFLALFLAFCKRRAEMDLLGEGASQHRKNLGQYTPEFLEQVTSVLAGCAIITYAMYTVDEGTAAKFGEDNDLVWSVPFVVFGLFRYLLLVQRQEGGGSPTRVLLGGDVIFVINALLWGSMVLGCLFL